jgi:hypothetical protein
VKVFEVEEDGSSEDEKFRLFKSQGKEGHQCQEWAGSDISYVSDTISKADRGVFTAEPLKAVWIFCRGVLLGKYICKFRLGVGVL